MKYYKEITVWDNAPNAENHVYYLNEDKSKMVGYIRAGTTELFKFKKPITFSTRGRKFEVLKKRGEPDSVYFGKPAEPVKERNSIEVGGKDGATYYVTRRGNSYSCTCKGFMFRHKCRHVEEIKETL